MKIKPFRASKKNKSVLRSLVLSSLHEHLRNPCSEKQLIKKMSIKGKHMIHEMPLVLNELVDEKIIYRTKNGHYKTLEKTTFIKGKVDHVNPHYAYVVVDEYENDVYVKTRNLKTAIHKDTVEIILLPTQKGIHPEGKVIRVLERNRTRFVGRIDITNGHAFIIPDFKKIYHDFFVPSQKTKGAQTNDKVLFEVTEWKKGNQCPEAKVVEVLGQAGENNAEIGSIISEFELPYQFSTEALQEAKKIEEKISDTEIQKRRDLRNTLTFTIDPEDAKDFDDALSFKALANGHYEIGIHIADVTHYIKPGTLLDQEAYHRGTSVYLVDRTIPMLPERLSNRLCSLRPKEDKLTFSAVFEMDTSGTLHKKWFGKTIIHSNHRFSYEEAQQSMKEQKGMYAKELVILNEIALQLRKKRFKGGAINFETIEIKFKLDEQGKPLEAVPKERKDTHKLVEEFMLLANKAVARHVFKNKQKGTENKFVYRIHDAPDLEKIEDLARFAKQFGHTVNTEEQSLSYALNGLMNTIEGSPEQNVLQQLAIRTMAKAQYTTKAKGHFGLAFDHYTHFTSPIRRYPDMMVHRMFYEYLNNHVPDDTKDYEAYCIHCSEREKRAANAERASVKYKQVELMNTAVDKVYEGMITGVSDFGIFIEIRETWCEGMVRLRDMRDDTYELDEKNFCVVGRRRKKTYQLGDMVQTCIKKTDIGRRIIDLSIES